MFFAHFFPFFPILYPLNWSKVFSPGGHFSPPRPGNAVIPANPIRGKTVPYLSLGYMFQCVHIVTPENLRKEYQWGSWRLQEKH
jgi:hypothetical protein